jgi:hypothetical protein
MDDDAVKQAKHYSHQWGKEDAKSIEWKIHVDTKYINEASSSSSSSSSSPFLLLSDAGQPKMHFYVS